MINSKTIEKAVYDLCVEANTVISDDVFVKILHAYENETNVDAKQALQLILKNAKMSYETKKPLCQDTGQVLVFVKVGEKAQVEKLNESINAGVSKAYEENFYRKSVVENALSRANTKTNTPCIIYTELVSGDNLEIEILLKGAGSENMSAVKMMSPTASEDEIADFVVDTIKNAGSNPCPPLFIGIGIGGTMEYAALLSKKALLLDKNVTENENNLAEKIKKRANDLKIGVAGFGGDSTVLDVKVLTDFTHIASMPTAVTINCHSSRHAKWVSEGRGKREEGRELPRIGHYMPDNMDFSDFIKINTDEIEKIKSLKKGDKVLLSGEIYTARDMAHKKLVELIEKDKNLPFDLINSIIFYAGPCPCPDGQVIGSVGPTTSSRMDKFAPIIYKKGALATIGKGERSDEVLNAAKQVEGHYFTVIGGIACYLSGCFIKRELVAFEELGTEAIYRLSVRDFPLTVSI